MKVLFDHPNPFLLAHGGFQIQIEQTKKALEEIGIEVEWLRWWDSSQSGDIIHYFGRPSASYVEFAHKKGLRLVMSELLTGLGSRTTIQRKAQKLLMMVSQQCLPSGFTAKLSWESYQMVDAAIALTPWERQLMIEMFDAPPQKVHVIPNAVEDVFSLSPRSSTPASRSEYLVCTATITHRKRVLELAEAAILAQTPLWVIGAPYSDSDPYYQNFLKVALASEGIIRYEGGISNRAKMAGIYQSSRGFVLLSSMESLSLSALEAAASGCPLLLSDLPWARSAFGLTSSYCPISCPQATGRVLKNFYDSAPTLSPPPPPHSWQAVVEKLRLIYGSLLNT